MTETIDPTLRYALLPGLPVFRRSDGDVQIGVEPPHWTLLRNAPPAAESVLNNLTGERSFVDLCRQQGTEVELWTDLLHELCGRGLAEQVDGVLPHLDIAVASAPERLSITHRLGWRRARRVLQARGDACVLLVGTGRVCEQLAALLVDVGVGVVELRPTPATAGRDPERIGPRWWQVLSNANDPRAPDVVIVTDPGPPPWILQDLHRLDLPHLLVRAGPAGGVVGPLIFPGRTACNRCVSRHRATVDDGWPVIEARQSRGAALTPPIAAAMTAGLAAAEILKLLDGDQEPSSVNGTLEWPTGAAGARRRSWSPHPDCECRR